MTTSRELDIVLFGATGYTGALAAEHIIKTFPTKLRWAVAGRYRASLEKLSEKLSTLIPNCLLPDIEVIKLDDNDLNNFVRRTRVVINAVGPYHRFSTPVVAVCAGNGTDYVNFTTETLWYKDLVDQFHLEAKASGALIIPAISNSSSPSDLTVWLAVKEIRDEYSQGTSEVMASSQLVLSGMSHGSFRTLLDLRDTYGSSCFLFGDSWIFSQESKPVSSTVPLISRLFGYRHVHGLGALTTSSVVAGNESVVHRSAGSHPELYGSNFTHHEYIPVSNVSAAVLVHFLTQLGNFVLIFPFLRFLLRYLAPAPSTGPNIENARKVESAEYKAVGVTEDGKKRVDARFAYKGAVYDLSAVLAVEAAAILVKKSKKDENEEVVRVGKGGILTPSSLGMEFVERLRVVGIEIKVGTL